MRHERRGSFSGTRVGVFRHGFGLLTLDVKQHCTVCSLCFACFLSFSLLLIWIWLVDTYFCSTCIFAWLLRTILISQASHLCDAEIKLRQPILHNVLRRRHGPPPNAIVCCGLYPRGSLCSERTGRAGTSSLTLWASLFRVAVQVLRLNTKILWSKFLKFSGHK